MKKILLAFFLFPWYLSAQDLQFEKSIDSLMSPANRNDMPESLLIIARDGKPVIRKAYGMASLELGTPASADHLFTLASVNKQMIAVCILQLAEKGKLKLTDDIFKYLPVSNRPGKLITVEQLLNHTSGIYSANSPARGNSFYSEVAKSGMLSDREFLNNIMKEQLLFEPGTDWSWNTFAFHIAFFIVEKASGMPFNEYVRKYLFEPAGMGNTFSKVDANRVGAFGIKNLNTSYYFPDADGKWMWRDARRLTPYFLYQRYSIVTCLDDLVKWDVALREGKLLSASSLQKAWTSGQMRDGRTTNYGLGWQVNEQDGYRLISAIGIGTNPICVVHVPQEKLYIAYTQFYGNIEQTEIRVKKILARLLPISYPVTGTTEVPLTEYTGIYQVHRTGFDIAAQISDAPLYIYISSGKDTLYLQQTAGDRIILRPAGKDRFLPMGSENTYYIFNRDANGRVTSISTRGSFWAYGPEVRNNKVSKPWPVPVKPKTISPELFEKYDGIYYLESFDSYLYIESDGGKLYNRVAGRNQELIPVSDNKFVRKGAEDVSYEFNRKSDGSTVLTVSAFRSLVYKKLDDL